MTISKVALDIKGNIFRINGNRLAEVNAASLTAAEREVRALSRMDYFRRPYNAVLAVQDNTIRSEWQIHPNTFFPQTPLDQEQAVEQYAREGFSYPIRLLSIPSDNCNSNCTICSFSGRHEPDIATDLDGMTYLDVLSFFSSRTNYFAHNLSGGGEPTVHPEFVKIMDFSGEHGLGVFLTTNGRLHPQENRNVLDSIAKNTSLLTVSMIGLGPAYMKLQRPGDTGITYDTVLDNIKYLLNKRDEYGRSSDMIVGVATTIHPENTGHYTELIRRLEDIGADYVYLNPIQPNLAKFGLHFTPDQDRLTKEEMASIADTFSNSGIFVRIPQVLYRETGTVYISAHERLNPDVCMVSMLQPSVIPVPGKPGLAKVLSCRYSKLHDDPSYWHSGELGIIPIEEIWTRENTGRVNDAARNCKDCCCERQMMALDWMLDVKRRIEPSSFMLQFDLDEKPGGVREFENTIATGYDRSNITESK